MISWIDIIIFLIVVRFAFIGYKRGGIGELIITVGFIVLCFLLYHFYNPIGKLLSSFFNIPTKYSYIVSYLSFIVGGIFLLWFIAKIITRVINISVLGVANKFLGVVLGAAKGTILCSLILYTAVIFKFRFLVELIPKGSLTNKYIIYVAPGIYEVVKGVLR